jgi:tagatose 6-phosphate kinase
VASGDVITTITLNPPLHVRYRLVAAQRAGGVGEPIPVGRPEYRAGGRGVTVARLLNAFGHDVLAAGLAGGAAGELVAEDLARSGVPTAFTKIRGESRRILEFGYPDGTCPARFVEQGPYITTEELGRFAADYRGLLAGAAAVVLSGSLPDGLPPDMYATLVRYAAEAGVPVILDAGGEELSLAIRNRPALAVADSPDPAAGHDLLEAGAAAVAILSGHTIRVLTPVATWTATVVPDAPLTLDRGALVAGLVPGELLGWSWPDRLKHALALAASAGNGADPDRMIDSAIYEVLLDSVRVTETPTSKPHRHAY